MLKLLAHKNRWNRWFLYHKCMDLRSDFEPITIHQLPSLAHAQCATIRMNTVDQSLCSWRHSLGLIPSCAQWLLLTNCSFAWIELNYDCSECSGEKSSVLFPYFVLQHSVEYQNNMSDPWLCEWKWDWVGEDAKSGVGDFGVHPRFYTK